MKRLGALILLVLALTGETAELKQSTAVDLKIGPFVDATDGGTPETGLTIHAAHVRLSKNGGTLAKKNEATNPAHDANGVYLCKLDATDTNTLGRLQIFVPDPNCAYGHWEAHEVVTANYWDSKYASDVRQVDLTQIGGNAVPCSAAYAFDDLATSGATTLERAIRGELEKAIDGDPNAGSIAERIKTFDDAYTATRGAYLDNIANALLLELGLSEIGDKVVADVDANCTAVDAVLANGAHGGAATVITLQTPIVANSTYMAGSALPTSAANVFSDLATATMMADTVRGELEKAIDGDPNSGSISERIKTFDDAYTATRGAYLDNIASKTGFSLASPQTFDLTGDITGNLSGSVGSVTGAVGSVTAGVDLADDAITSAKFDESTAFALGSADTGATAVARVGADSDTLETLSDEIAAIAGDASAANQTTIINHLTDIKGPTWSADTDQLEDIRDRGDAAWTTGSGTGLSPIGAGTAQAGTGQTITLAAGSTFATSTLIGQKISIHSGTGIGQTNYITGYDATSKVARCLNPWFVTPDATSVYEIVAGEGRVLEVLLGKR